VSIDRARLAGCVLVLGTAIGFWTIVIAVLWRLGRPVLP